MLVNSTFQLLPRPRVIEIILICEYCEYCSNLLRRSRHKSPQLESQLTELGFINSEILSEEESLYFPNTPSPLGLAQGVPRLALFIWHFLHSLQKT